MTTVEAEVLDEFDLDIQIDDTDLPARKHAPRAYSGTVLCSCTGCCPSVWCNTATGCSMACN